MTTTDSTITRRAFIAAGGAALAATATRSFPLLAAPQPRLRMALVGTGNRGSLTWGQEVVKGYSDVVSVDFHECLDTSHGADYFRRWHRLKQNSGTLLVHKASHHFDLANWWLDSMPMEVTAFGDLKFYGHNNSFRSTHCRVCPYKQQCKFYWDVTQNPQYVKL